VVLAKPEETGWLRIMACARTVAGCLVRKRLHICRIRFARRRVRKHRGELIKKAAAVRTVKTGRSIIAVRQTSPSGRLKLSPIPRTSVGESAKSGLPPASERRPITGTCPAWKTTARERGTPRPLL
jgi:hypothetical protein